MKNPFFIGLLALMFLQPAQAQSSQHTSIFPSTDSCNIYLRTDKDFYLAGEIIWFKAHLLDSVKRPLKHNQLLLVELVNSEKAVVQQQILTEKGSAAGSIYLPLFLQQGYYRLRAYLPETAPDHFSAFVKDLPLVNTFEKQSASKRPVNNWGAKSFAEANLLVQGQPGRIAVQAQTSTGNPIDFDAFIVQGNDTISQFASHKFGMGSLNFTPDSTAGYQLWVRHQDSTQEISFPNISKDGINFRSSRTASGYQVEFYNRNPSQGKSVLAMIHQEPKKVAQRKISFKDSIATWNIPKEELPAGISRLTVFDVRQNPIGERLLFRKPEKLLPLKVSGLSEKYPLRSKVSLQILGPPATQASVSVFHLDSLQKKPGSSILSYLWLDKELRGEIYHPDYYFGESTPEREKAIENLMLTHGWRSFKNGASPPTTGWPGHKVRIKVLNKRDGSAVIDQTVFLSVPGKNYQFYSASTDSSGMVEIIADKLYGSGKVLLYLPEYGQDVTFKLQSPFSNTIAHFNEALFVDERFSQTLQELSLSMQLQNVYHQAERQILTEIPANELHFFGQPDVVYELDNYTRFPTMEEVLREFTREVKVRKKGDDFQLRMFYDLEDRFFDEKPLLLVDGVPVSENTLMELDPLQVEKLEIIDNRYLYGSYFINGIVSFDTYKGDVEVEELNAEAYETRYQGLEAARVFYSPLYASDTLQRIPDYRNTLYWNPELNFDDGGATAEFFTGDRPGRYLIRVEGIDQLGRANFSETILEVESQKKSALQN